VSDNISQFDKIANKYESWYEDPVNACMDRQEKDAVKEALEGVGSHCELLDVGCGTGHWSRFFHELNFQVTGLDISGNMLEAAKEKGPAEIRYIGGDAHRLPFEDESFKVCSAITSLEFVEKPEIMLREMWRVVQPGGRIVLGVLNRFSIIGIRRKILARKTIFSRAHFYSMKELKDLLSKIGRCRVTGSTFCLPWEWALPYADLLEEFGRLHFPFWGAFLVGILFKFRR